MKSHAADRSRSNKRRMGGRRNKRLRNCYHPEPRFVAAVAPVSGYELYVIDYYNNFPERFPR